MIREDGRMADGGRADERSDGDGGRTGGTLAFICAMPMELVPLARRLRLRRDGDVSRGTLGTRPVVATVTGMGTELAEEGTRRLLAAEGPIDHVVVVGITGATGPEPAIGTVIRPRTVIHSGTGSEHRPVHLGPGSATGTMWTTDSLTTDLGELVRLRDRGVVCLDMETAAIAAVCDEQGVSWSVVRAVSDRADDGSVDAAVFSMSKQDGSPDWPSVLRFVVTRPHRLPGLAAVGRNARRAASLAADAAVEDCSGGSVTA
jgi:adenosylhomocysteine nucleosidase